MWLGRQDPLFRDANLSHQMLLALARVVTTEVILRPEGRSKTRSGDGPTWDFLFHQSGMVGVRHLVRERHLQGGHAALSARVLEGRLCGNLCLREKGGCGGFYCVFFCVFFIFLAGLEFSTGFRRTWWSITGKMRRFQVRKRRHVGDVGPLFFLVFLTEEEEEKTSTVEKKGNIAWRHEGLSKSEGEQQQEARRIVRGIARFKVTGRISTNRHRLCGKAMW